MTSATFYEDRPQSGSARFTSLSYSFSVEWDRMTHGEFTRYVLGAFEADPVPDVAYRFADLGPGVDHRHVLIRDDKDFLTSRDFPAVFYKMLWDVYHETLERCDDLLLIHAGVVARPRGGVIVLPAGSGSGKSTLTAGLVEAGFDYLSDEICALEVESLTVQPYPRALNLKEGSLPVLRAAEKSRGFVRRYRYLAPADIRADSLGRSGPLAAIVFPAYLEGAATEIARMSRADAVASLWEQVLNAPVFGPKRTFGALIDSCSTVSTYRLVSGSLSEAVAAIGAVDDDLEARSP